MSGMPAEERNLYGGEGSPDGYLAGFRDSKPQFNPPMGSINEEFNEQTIKFTNV